jgi:RNA-dependent RNA polymerase
LVCSIRSSPHLYSADTCSLARIDGGGERRYLEGPVLVTRSPCMHPGDVQLVRAIGRPPIGSPFMKDVFPNCVVFSTLGREPFIPSEVIYGLSCISTGSRSLPSRLGGGDLDGDLYNLITYEELHPLRTVPGAKYDPPLLKEVSWRCTIADIANFVVDYINSDILGILSSRHLIIADQSDLGVEDPDCLALAELHSKAVDFFKSGTPVHIPELPPQKFRQQPDWSMGEGKRHRTHFYTSDKALGQLFRAIELGNAPVNKNNMGRRVTYPQATLLFNSPKARLRRLHDSISLALRPLLQQESITLEPSQTSVKEGLHHFLAYETELRNICTMHTVSSHDKPLSEEEIFMDIILADILDR